MPYLIPNHPAYTLVMLLQLTTGFGWAVWGLDCLLAVQLAREARAYLREREAD